MKNHCWQTQVTRIKKLIPRNERIFLPLVPPVSEGQPKYLRVKGVVTKVWCNGVLLRKEANRYPIPLGVEKPWENEFLISGIPMAAWIEGNKKSGILGPGTISRESNPLGAAGRALVSFVVDQGVDKGDMFSFYDPVSSTYRMPGWRWDSGICLEALAKLARYTGDKTYKRAMDLVVKRFLAVQLSDSDCPGGFPETSDLHMASRRAPVLPQWVVPFNGAFIGAGLLSAMEVVDPDLKDPCIRAAQNAYGLMVSKGMNPQGFLKGYYHLRNQSWQYHGQINDSGIFPRLANLLSKHHISVDSAPMEHYAKAMTSFIQPEGFVGRARWMPGNQNWVTGTPLFPEWKTRPKQIPGKIFSRGQAWYLLGAAASWQLTGSRSVSRTMRGVMDYLMDHQDRTGFWHHDLGQPAQGLDVKGTAVVIWSLLEAREAFVAAGGDSQQLSESIAQGWYALTNNQKEHMPGPLPGGLRDDGKEGAIIYFRNRPMYTAYGLAAFILSGLAMEKGL